MLKYFIKYILLPFHTVAKKFLKLNHIAYDILLLLNIMWLCYLAVFLLYWVFRIANYIIW